MKSSVVKIGLMVASVVFLFSCNDDEKQVVPETLSSEAFYVVNEGSFLANNASISFVSESGEVSNNYFAVINDRELGDVNQSMSISSDYASIVVNNSQKVEIVNAESFTSVKTISGLSYPRYSLFNENELYISNGANDGKVYVTDAKFAIVDSIVVGKGPEKFLKNNGDLLVVNTGGWGVDSTVSVIDMTTHAVKKTISLSDIPKDIVKDAEGNIWVICSGRTIYDDNWAKIGETASKIWKINGSSYAVDKNFTIGELGTHVSQLEINKEGTQLIFTSGKGISTIATSAEKDNSTVIVSGSFYGLNVDANTGEIYSPLSSDFVSGSTLKRYSTTGAELASYEVGIGANAVVFKVK